jgi:hydroxymethylpyrimidine/phosphomethylpyrimidine kinase
VPPIILSIAGFDPSSGAGITADVKTAAAHGCYAICGITALTVQSTSGVQQVVPAYREVLRATLFKLADDMEIAAVRIGMLGTGAIGQEVVNFLQRRPMRKVVLDPILTSSSGASLLDADGVSALFDLLALCDVVTPNVDEAARLTDMHVSTIAEAGAAAARLHELGAPAVVVKGGHLAEPVDLLSYNGPAGRTVREFPGNRLSSPNTHGTGCAFATSLACQLALRLELPEAVGAAKQYVAGAIAAGLALGRGTGPVNHFWKE